MGNSLRWALPCPRWHIKESLVIEAKQWIQRSLPFWKVLHPLRSTISLWESKSKPFFLFPMGKLRHKRTPPPFSFVCLNGVWSTAHYFTSCKLFSTKASGIHEIKLKHTHITFWPQNSLYLNKILMVSKRLAIIWANVKMKVFLE